MSATLKSKQERESKGPGIDLLDNAAVRALFPILNEKVHGKPLVYLDNAATTQKPRQVIEALHKYYERGNSNIHRGVHRLSEQATADYEAVRNKVASFIGAASEREIIFTRGTTDSINLVAGSLGKKHIGEGDEIIISAMEHHSNIVPWQMLCLERKAVLRVIPMNDEGELLLGELEPMINERTKLVSVVHVSNSLGTVNPVKEIIEIAHRKNVLVLIDGAQSVQHVPVNVKELDCDFYAFSGHKMYGPTGIGVLYGKENILNEMPPVQGGGDMIMSVTFEKTTYNELPYKFEAGTPNIAGVIGLGAAIDLLNELSIPAIADCEHKLLELATGLIQAIPQVRIIGTAKEKSAALSFVVENIHPHDIGTIMDREGIAIRTGHHCTQPVMHRFGIPATSRMSVAFYNTRAEIIYFAEALKRTISMFA